MFNIEESPLYSEDLAPVPQEKRNWTKWHLAALWVGIAVCIPTYLLASYMIKAGMGWLESILIIAIANLIITIPMVLNGQAGVKYGLPFPVIGRAAFGTTGIHLASVLRGLVACGWFGINAWIGGLSFYAIYCAVAGVGISADLTMGKFIAFGLFWLMNIYFIWKGTEAIRWLEEWSAPILILIGMALLGWGWYGAGGVGIVLQQSPQLAKQTATINKENIIELQLIQDKTGKTRATEYKIFATEGETSWNPIQSNTISLEAALQTVPIIQASGGENLLKIQFRGRMPNDSIQESSKIPIVPKPTSVEQTLASRLWNYVLWLTIMVGFWATMSISISDITRYARSQNDQVVGQFLGLPLTMVFYSFIGIFVTCAAIINFDDILIAEDAPWEPASLLSRFENPLVVIIAQIAMIIATLSTNIAANIIAPAYAFANLFPKQLSFRSGGIVAGVIGIVICPWWLMGSISGLLIFVSGFLGPILGVLMADYFIVRRKELNVPELFNPNGIYAGVNSKAMIALGLGILVALIGFLVPALAFLYTLSWFVGFAVSFVVYSLLGKQS